MLRRGDGGEVAAISGAIASAGMTAHGLVVQRNREHDGQTERALSLFAFDPGAAPALTLSAEATVKQYGGLFPDAETRASPKVSPSSLPLGARARSVPQPVPVSVVA